MRQQDFTCLRTSVGPNDAVFFHEVDQSGGASIADSQRSLQQRNAATTFANNDFDRVLIHLVTFLQASNTATVFILNFQIHKFIDKMLLRRTHRSHNSIDFIVTQKGSLATE